VGLRYGANEEGISLFFLKQVANYQYTLANTIGIQTPGNRKYFQSWTQTPNHKLEVLHNWITPAHNQDCSIDISKTILNGRFIFVYAGNMGVAQNVRVFLELAILIRDRSDIGFVFVGRGSELESLKSIAQVHALDNVLFLMKSLPKKFQVYMLNVMRV